MNKKISKAIFDHFLLFDLVILGEKFVLGALLLIFDFGANSRTCIIAEASAEIFGDETVNLSASNAVFLTAPIFIFASSL